MSNSDRDFLRAGEELSAVERQEIKKFTQATLLINGPLLLLIILLGQGSTRIAAFCAITIVVMAGIFVHKLQRPAMHDVLSWLLAIVMTVLFFTVLLTRGRFTAAMIAGFPLLAFFLCIVISNPWHAGYAVTAILVATGVMTATGILDATWSEYLMIVLTSATVTVSVSSANYVYARVFAAKTRDQERLRQLLRAEKDAADQVREMLSNMKVMNKELQRSTDRLRQTNQTRTSFLANMSHELRTPLNAIIGYAEMLLPWQGYSEVEKADINAIYDSGRHLLNLINNLLDMARIETGKMKLMRRKQHALEPVEHAVSIARGYLRQKGKEHVGLEAVTETNLPEVWIDETRIVQILVNLLSNAIKFTDEGSITLNVYSKDEYVYYEVVDTGRGIKEETIPRLFERYRQASEHDEGIGLGLPVSRELAVRHGGGLEAASEAGQGSRFTLYIPVASAEGYGIISGDPDRYIARKESRTKPLVLAVDNEINSLRMYQRALLSHYTLKTFSNSIEAERHILSLKRPEEMPIAVIVDLLMPHKDGWDLIQSIRRNQRTKDLPVIIASITSEEDAPKGLRHDMQVFDWLEKPISKDRLMDSLARVEEKEPLCVLAVSSEHDTRLQLRVALEQRIANVTVYEALTTRSALEEVESIAPDLVILDMRITGASGLHLFLREEKVPTVALHSRSASITYLPHDRASALQRAELTDENLMTAIENTGVALIEP